jgi:hypothetical protein
VSDAMHLEGSSFRGGRRQGLGDAHVLGDLTFFSEPVAIAPSITKVWFA